MVFEDNIKNWVSVDNQIKHINEKLKELKNTKNSLEEDIQNYLIRNNIDNPTIEITDGKLKFGTTKIQSPLTYKYIQSCLQEVINNNEHVDVIMNVIKTNRDSKLEKNIKRSYNK